MFYSSLLGDIRGEYEREKGKSLPIVFSTEGLEDVTECKVLHDKIGKRVLVGGTNAENGNGEMVNIFSFAETGKDMEAKPTPFKNAPNFTYGELADTEENPIVVVLTKGIRFFSDIPTYVEVLYINNDMMLVSLIYGACEFQFADGSYIPLQRCNEYDLNRDILVTLDCKALKEKTLCQTKGGYDKSYNQVCPLLVRGKTGAKSSISVRCLSHEGYVFDVERVENALAKEKAAYEKRKADAEEKRVANAKKTEEILKAEEARKREAIEARKRAATDARKSKAGAKRATAGKTSTKRTEVIDVDGESEELVDYKGKRNPKAEAFLNLFK